MIITEAPRNTATWAYLLSTAEIPVLQRTIEELARLREDEDALTARDISRVLLHDPLFTLRVLQYLQAHRRPTQVTDITTVEHALMMLGVTPFFEQFAKMPSVEQHLDEYPHALAGLMDVMSRAHCAALYAHDWAVVRHDIKADEVAIAALLHDLAEMLLWCFAPDLALQILKMLRADKALRTRDAQQTVLGFRILDLQNALMIEWKLAAMLQSLMDDAHPVAPARQMNVALAVNLARHSAHGWDNPALPDDYAAIQKLLNLAEDEVLDRVQRVALQADKGRAWYHLEKSQPEGGPEG
jgi:HD-like signal output (HDOD) protein